MLRGMLSLTDFIVVEDLLALFLRSSMYDLFGYLITFIDLPLVI